jgi:enolase-phosphatase E1
MPDVDAVLLDIEGTISSQSFVVANLFAYSRRRMAEFVAAHAGEPDVAQILADARALAEPGEDPVTALVRWIDEDRKAAPLKSIQGLIWEEGYEEGALRGHIFPDALEVLTRWHAAGIPLHIFSSGSEQCQVGFFRRVPEGDLRHLFTRHFDLRIGPKVETASYEKIAAALGLAPSRLLFFSDNPRELAAARAAGLPVVQVLREDTRPDPRFRQIHSFADDDLAAIGVPAGR